MKLLFASLILSLVFGGLLPVNAQDEGTVKVKVGKQKRESKSRLTIKFLSVVEDSRCAEGTQCIWAGNARIKVSVEGGEGGKEVFEINTTSGGPLGAKYESYAITLTALTPSPKANVRLNRNAYTATFSVTRLSR